jgi:mRNA-degrading endonuclease toxin of MazEF toxin-antitoxin module
VSLNLERGATIIARMPQDRKAGRPALVIRSNTLTMTDWVAVLPFTSDPGLEKMPYWIKVEPTAANGLIAPSWLMIDWPQTVWLNRIDRVIGALDASTLARVTAHLAAALGV